MPPIVKILLSLDDVSPELRAGRRATQEIRLDVRDENDDDVASAIVPLFVDELDGRIRFEGSDSVILRPEED